MIGEVYAPGWLETRWVLAAFAAAEAQAVECYTRFVAEGMGQPSPWEYLKQQVFLGSEAFVESMQRKIPQDRDLREVPQAKARQAARPLDEYARRHPDRNLAIAAAYASGGYTMREIGDHFGLHYSRVSKIVRATDRTSTEAQGKT